MQVTDHEDVEGRADAVARDERSVDPNVRDRFMTEPRSDFAECEVARAGKGGAPWTIMPR